MNSSIKQAMIFCAGLGSRLRPITDTIPKALAEVQGQTLLDRSINMAIEAGIEDITLNAFYKADVLKQYVANHYHNFTKCKITIIEQEELYGNAGGLLYATTKRDFKWPLLVINGDPVFYNYYPDQHPIKSLLNAWDGEKMEALLSLCEASKVWQYEGKGDFDLSTDTHLIRRTDGASMRYIYTSAAIITPALIEGKQVGEKFNLMEKIFRSNQSNYSDYRYYGLQFKGNWLSIETPEMLTYINQIDLS
jgi:MurNAc alpha-1-phosphate uridylyltransferase